MIQRRSLLAGLLLAGMAPGIVRASSLVRSKVIVPDYRGLVILDRSGNLLCASSARAWGVEHAGKRGDDHSQAGRDWD